MIRYEPQLNAAGMAPFRAQGTVQLITFVCLVMVPTTTFKYFVAPVGIIYSFGFWAVHLNALNSDLALLGVILQYANSSLIAIFVGYVSQ